MKLILRPVLMIMFLVFGKAFAQAPNLTSYYFPENEQCTLVLDFQSHRPKLDQLSKETRNLTLAKDLLIEFKANGSIKCPEARKVRLLAVFIPGTDNYGRPDFGSRTNLLRLEGPIERVLQSADRDFATVEQIGDLLITSVF
jgi:hypothetical protein